MSPKQWQSARMCLIFRNEKAFLTSEHKSSVTCHGRGPRNMTMPHGQVQRFV